MLSNNDTITLMNKTISEWATNFNVNLNTLNGLLEILRSSPFNLTSLPKDSRTLMKTLSTQTALQVYKVEPGEYYHFVLANGIKKYFKYFILNNETDTVEIVVGIDGLPITKRSTSQFWQILEYIKPHKHFIFLIGLYWGYKKPQDGNTFLEKFVLEAKKLLGSGIIINGIHKKLAIAAFCLDAPARSFILKIKGHLGYNSCSRCLHEGEYLQNRLCFPFIPSGSVSRTHYDYINKRHDDHHTSDSLSILID